MKDNKFTKAGEYDIRILVVDTTPGCYDHTGAATGSNTNAIKVITKANVKVYDKIDRKLTNTSKLNASTVTLGDKITIAGKASNNYGTVKYSFSQQPPESTKWYTIGTAYDGKTTGSFKPGKKGVYKIKVIAKDEMGFTSEKILNCTVK